MYWYVVQVTREARESVLAAMFQHDIPPPFVAQKGLTTSWKCCADWPNSFTCAGISCFM